MGLFNSLFGRAEAIKDEGIGRQSGFENNANGHYIQNSTSGPITVFAPKSYAEVEKIIGVMREGKTVVVHLTQVKTDTAIRILDMLSGAIFALGGGVYEMQQNIFMFSKNGVEVEQ